MGFSASGAVRDSPESRGSAVKLHKPSPAPTGPHIELCGDLLHVERQETPDNTCAAPFQAQNNQLTVSERPACVEIPKQSALCKLCRETGWRASENPKQTQTTLLGALGTKTSSSSKQRTVRRRSAPLSRCYSPCTARQAARCQAECAQDAKLSEESALDAKRRRRFGRAAASVLAAACSVPGLGLKGICERREGSLAPRQNCGALQVGPEEFQP